MLTHSTAVLSMLLGAFLISVAFPFIAVLVLDGVVALFRRVGVKPLIAGIVATAAVGAAAYVLWKFGVDELLNAPDQEAYIQSIRDTVRRILNFTVPLALFAFLIRVIVLLVRRRRAGALDKFER